MLKSTVSANDPIPGISALAAHENSPESASSALERVKERVAVDKPPVPSFHYLNPATSDDYFSPTEEGESWSWES